MDTVIKEKVMNSFQQQQVMKTIGASIHRLEPGTVEVMFPFSPSLTQQHGFLHAGIVTTAMDSACGYAALSTMPPNAGILSIEFKVNLLAPARGKKFIAVGKVIKAGQNITVTQGELLAFAKNGSQEGKLVSTMTATMMSVYNRDDISN